MKCVKQALLVVLLIFLVGSPLFAGWDAFRKPSSTSSMESLDISKEIPETVEEAQQETLSPEVKTESETIDENSKSYEENSANYEEKLKATEAVLEEAEAEIDAEKSDKKAEKKMEAVEEAKVIVEDLVTSKAALDENYNILADLALKQMKDIKHLQRKEVFQAGFGPVIGYKYLETIPVGFDLGFLFNEEWAVDVIMTYDVHATGGFHQFRNPTPENIGVLLSVKKYF